MNKKQVITITLLGAHLLCIACLNITALAFFNNKSLPLNERSQSIVDAATEVNKLFPKGLNTFIQGYSKYTGITGYVFFSPNPPDSYRVIFSYTQGDQNVLEELPMQTFEGNLRKLCAYDFLKSISDQEFKDLMARSIAARFFELHPGVNDMTLTSFYYQLPSMEDYVKGEKPRFLEDFTYTFNFNE